MSFKLARAPTMQHLQSLDDVPFPGGTEAMRRELERLRALATRERGFLGAILTHSPHGIIVCDAAGRLVLFNRAAEHIWAGESDADDLGEWARYRAFHPDGRPYAAADWPMVRALRHGEVVDAEEVAIQRFDGSRAVLLASTAPLVGLHGDVEGAIWVFADITAFKEKERALLERERATADRLARLHAFTAALSEATDLADVARVTVEHGEPALGAAGGAVWFAPAGGAAELLHLDGLPAGTADAWRVLEPGDAQPHAVALRDGTAAWLSSRTELEARWPALARALPRGGPPVEAFACAPLELHAARLGVVAFTWTAPRAFDPDDRALLLALARQAAQALDRARLLDAERRTRAEAEAAQGRMGFLYEASVILASSLDYEDTLASVARLAVPRVAICCAIDLGDGAPVVAHADAAKVELARELVRDSPAAARVLHSGRPELHAGPEDAVLRELASRPDQLGLARALGVGSAMVVPMSARGRTLGTLTFVSGPHRRFGAADLEMAHSLGRRAALAIDNARLYAEAQQAIRARDDVLAIVSHDLRNPLHAIVMASNLLARPTSAPDRARAHAAAIQRSASRMGRLIRDLLESSRLESGRVALERQVVLAGSMLGEAAAAIQPIAAEKGVRVRIVPGAEALEVHCDRDRTLQVLANLLGNAVTFTPAGGEIALSAEPLPDGGARISVADSGIGIPEADQERIFDRYWKSRESRQGTGLGLSIAKAIVEAHGGRIWVESRSGAGATFHFTLPRGAHATGHAG